jgi:hypothetical protein
MNEDNDERGYTTFKSIRIFFDVEQKRIMFHNGDQDHFTAVYSPFMHLIEVVYFDSKTTDPKRIFTVSAPRKLKDNIEVFLYDPNITIDIEGTTGKEYDRKKKEMFEIIKESDKTIKKEEKNK